MKFNEVINHGRMGEIDEPEFQTRLLDNSVHIEQISQDINLWSNIQNGKKWYFTIKDSEITASVLLDTLMINNKNYYSINMIYVFEKFRNTKAIYWLIFAVKELLNLPVIADGAIFKGGQNLIKSIITHKLMMVNILDKATGTLEKLNQTNIGNDPDLCYVFESTQLGFGKQIFPEGMEYTWYPCFEDVKNEN